MVAALRLGLTLATLLFLRPPTATAQITGASSAVASTLNGLPLTPERVVRFRVSEGTWMSLDVSPDGRTIAFDLLDDLYILPITGGLARKLTSGTALNRQPRYSPDGRHLVFVSDRSGSENIWIADQHGGRARQLSALHGYDGAGAVTSPAWSPDGRTVIVSQRLGPSRPGGVSSTESRRWLLAAYDVSTGHMRWVSDTTPEAARSVLGATFGVDTHAVYAAVDGASRKVPWQDPATWQIARIDLQTRRITPEMGANVGRHGMRPTVSRDGRYLVYASNSGSHLGLRLRELRTDSERWIVQEALADVPFAQSESRDLTPGYAFTPDSKALIVAYGGKIHRIDIATGRSSVIPFVAEVERRLGRLGVHQFTLADKAVRTRSVLQPALSPDGSRVAFTALDRIWVMQLPRDGQPAGRPYRATAETEMGEFYPSWSPDGRWLFYSTWVDGEGGGVRRVRVAHDPVACPPPSDRLTSDTAVYFHTAAAPDGERLVAVRAALPPEQALSSQVDSPPINPELVWLPVAGGPGGTIASLTSVHSAWFRYPVDQVYFTDDPARIYVGLTSWRWDGTDRQTALAVTARERSTESGFEPYDVAGVVAPDGRRVLISRKYALLELSPPTPEAGRADTLDLDRARTQPFGIARGAAHDRGTAIGPWISWSRDHRRALVSQGGTLFIGEVRPDTWTTFERLDVPLMIPVDLPRGIIVLRGARLITMRGKEVIEQGDLVVRDNRIAAVGRTGQLALPEAARVLDVAGTTIIPGYVNAHDHPFPPKGVHPQQLWQYLARLGYGVTTSRDPAPGLDNEVFTYQERERSGDLLAPRLFSTGVPYYGADPPLRTLDGARDRVVPNASYFRSETYKVYYEHLTDRRTRQFLTMAANSQRINATAHTNGLELALASVIDGLSGIEHAPDIGFYDDVATLIARSGTTYTLTYGGAVWGSLAYMRRRQGWPWAVPKLRRLVPNAALRSMCTTCTGEQLPSFGPLELDNLLPLIRGGARIVRQGGSIALGDESDLAGLGYHWEMWLHALGGMSTHEILRSATIVGATAIGHANDFGSLEPGKVADLQVLDKNPLDDIYSTTSIRYVMKNGRLYRADNLTEVWPRHKPLASQYLHDTGARR